jgi:hypothetical protein
MSEISETPTEQLPAAWAGRAGGGLPAGAIHRWIHLDAFRVPNTGESPPRIAPNATDVQENCFFPMKS